MDKEMLQKVLDFIREGATAASGPAKWGFEQVCAYNAMQAKAYLIALVTLFLLSVVALMVFIYLRRNPPMVKRRYVGSWFHAYGKAAEMWGPNDDKHSVKEVEWMEEGGNEWVTGGVIGSVIASVVFLLLLLGFGPQLYATTKNPVGATLNSIISNH
jgi:hypothetical protein